MAGIAFMNINPAVCALVLKFHLFPTAFKSHIVYVNSDYVAIE